jgi:hypothetical protein
MVRTVLLVKQYGLGIDLVRQGLGLGRGYNTNLKLRKASANPLPNRTAYLVLVTGCLSKQVRRR